MSELKVVEVDMGHYAELVDKHKALAADEMYEMLERIMGNYQVAASAADHEGYVTGYNHDAALVDALLAKARGE